MTLKAKATATFLHYCTEWQQELLYVYSWSFSLLWMWQSHGESTLLHKNHKHVWSLQITEPKNINKKNQKDQQGWMEKINRQIEEYWYFTLDFLVLMTELVYLQRCCADLMKPIVKHLQDLELTDQENALMSSVCIMHPGQCSYWFMTLICLCCWPILHDDLSLTVRCPYHDLPVTQTWLYHDLPVAQTWLYHDLLVTQTCPYHDLPVAQTYLWPRLILTYPWPRPGSTMTNLWLRPDSTMTYLWPRPVPTMTYLWPASVP